MIKPYLPVTIRRVYYVLRGQGVECDDGDVEEVLRLGRLAGFIPWDCIADSSRVTYRWGTCLSIKEYLEQGLTNYASDWHRDQTYRFQIWVEKQALEGVFINIAKHYQIPLILCKGQNSLSQEYYEAGWFKQYSKQKSYIFYLSDLNPSGKRALVGVKKNFKTFRCLVEIEDVALTVEQAQDLKDVWKPLTKDGKPLIKEGKTKPDTNLEWFIDTYHFEHQVDLDALPPEKLITTLNRAIQAKADIKLIEKHKQEDENMKKEWRERNDGLPSF